MVKMLQSSNSGKRRIKSIVWGHGRVINMGILEQSSKYTPVSRARGVPKHYIFFFYYNRV
jgi:hypothetical protein